MIKWGSESDCFEPFEISPERQLQPGCFIVWRNKKTNYGHTIMIQKTGEDPFGLNSQSDCKNLNTNTWDFQESESLIKYGPSQWEARSRFGKSRYDLPAMLILARKTCEAVKADKTIPADISEGDWSIKVLCHAGKKKASCVGKNNRTFKDESCIFSCTNVSEQKNSNNLQPIKKKNGLK